MPFVIQRISGNCNPRFLNENDVFVENEKEGKRFAHLMYANQKAVDLARRTENSNFVFKAVVVT